MLREIEKNQRISDKIAIFRGHITTGNVVRPSDVSKFVFLCGANKEDRRISERRKALLSFAQHHLPKCKFFLAEKVFECLQEEGHRGNILDVENKISEFADTILIILESPSAFAELGAFSHKELRNKLIVINDKKYHKSSSFINLGPIKAIEEAGGNERIVSYPMRPDGIDRMDAIGDTFAALHSQLKVPAKSKSKSQPLFEKDLDPKRVFNKDSAMLVHDLVYITGPIKYKELIMIMLKLFGQGSYDIVKQLLGLLVAFEAIEKNDKALYKSKQNACFLSYPFDVDSIISSFRNVCLKYHSDRIYEY